ncbi:MAG: hypothetical protein EBX40_05790 [Gammaproteobacteria bacterium]|nr:hypothetical protein [Gammaproteobacteria bacterium]
MAQINRTRYDIYISLLQRGVPSMEAYRQAFPQGIETGQKTPEQQAKDAQKRGYAQLGGMITGALATRGIAQALSGERVFGETRDAISNLFKDATPATPTGVMASRIGSSAGPTTPSALGATKVTEVPAGSTMTPEGNVLSPDGTVKDITNGMTLGSWVDTGLGVLQVYQGVKQFKQGDKLAGALGTTAGLAKLAEKGAEQLGLGGTQTLGNIAGGVGAAYGAYNLGRMALKGGEYSKSDTGNLAAQGALSGASIGSYFGGPVGAGIGAALGGLYGFISGFSGSGKGLRQKVRDKWRDAMLENNIGLFDQNYQGTLPDGSKFDWGKDKFTFGKKEGDIDLENPVVGKAAAYGNVLAAIQGATDTKPREAIATQFLAAGTTNAKNDMEKMRANMKYFFGKLGMTGSGAQAELDRLKAEGKLKDDEYQVFSSDLAQMLR